MRQEATLILFHVVFGITNNILTVWVTVHLAPAVIFKVSQPVRSGAPHPAHHLGEVGEPCIASCCIVHAFREVVETLKTTAVSSSLSNIREPELPCLSQPSKVSAPVVEPDVPDLVKGVKLKRTILVDGGSDVVHILRLLHLFQLPDAGHVGEPVLDISPRENSWCGGKRVESGPEDLPPGEPVAIVVKVHLVQAANVHGQNVLGSFLLHDVRR